MSELIPVRAGEIIKLQKPQHNTFINVKKNNDGIDIGDCSVCGADNVIVNDHICKTLLDQKYEGIANSNMLTKINLFKKQIFKK